MLHLLLDWQRHGYEIAWRSSVAQRIAFSWGFTVPVHEALRCICIILTNTVFIRIIPSVPT